MAYYDFSPKELVKVGIRLEQQERVQCEASPVAHGVAEDVHPGTCSLTTARRLGRREPRATALRPLWLWFAFMAVKHAALKLGKPQRAKCPAAVVWTHRAMRLPA